MYQSLVIYICMYFLCVILDTQCVFTQHSNTMLYIFNYLTVGISLGRNGETIDKFTADLEVRQTTA